MGKKKDRRQLRVVTAKAVEVSQSKKRENQQERAKVQAKAHLQRTSQVSRSTQEEGEKKEKREDERKRKRNEETQNTTPVTRVQRMNHASRTYNGMQNSYPQLRSG